MINILVVIVVVAGVVAAGIALLVKGVRGRVVGDHPMCRGCGFDLYGRPEGSGRCAECGADLSDDGAVVVGRRRRRAGLIAAGMAVLLPSAAVMSLVAWQTATEVTLVSVAPHWYVLRQARDPRPAVHDPALTELHARLTGGSLSDARVLADVDTGLAIQADRSAAWSPGWGDLIEAARTAGKVDDARWKTYLGQIPSTSVVVRPKVRRGEPVVMYLVEGGSRCGTVSRMWARTGVEVLPDSDLIRPAERGDHGRSGGTVSSGGGSSIGHTLTADKALTAAAADGPKGLHVVVRTDLFSVPPQSDDAVPDASCRSEQRVTWTLVPADAPTVRAVRDESLRAAVERSIAVQQLRVYSFAGDRANVTLRITRPPVALAYRVSLRARGREWSGGTAYVAAGGTMALGTSCDAGGLTGDRVDLVLRPDAATAANTLDITDYWAGEIVLHDVKVERERR